MLKFSVLGCIKSTLVLVFLFGAILVVPVESAQAEMEEVIVIGYVPYTGGFCGAVCRAGIVGFDLLNGPVGGDMVDSLSDVDNDNYCRDIGPGTATPEELRQINWMAAACLVGTAATSTLGGPLGGIAYGAACIGAFIAFQESVCSD